VEVARVELLFSCSQLASSLRAELRVAPITVSLLGGAGPGAAGNAASDVPGGAPFLAAGDAAALEHRRPSLVGAAPGALGGVLGADACVGSPDSGSGAAVDPPLLQVSELAVATALHLIGCAPCWVYQVAVTHWKGSLASQVERMTREGQRCTARWHF
jgi:hypothetical protein